MPADIRDFGHARDGRRVRAVTLTSARLSATVLTWGAALQDLRLAGIGRSLTLGGDRMAAYEGPMGYFGTIVGPVANRLAGARAMIDGRECRFPANEGTTSLHSGPRGVQARHWALEEAGTAHLRLALVLEDGDDGYPGRRRITADYRVDDDALTLRLRAETDAPTLMNLANHSYWNLDGTETFAGHRLRLAADRYVATVDDIPTGEERPVHDAFDLRDGRVLDLTEGYNHNFCLAPAVRDLTEVAVLTGTSGVTLRMATTEPGVQVYDGRFLDTAPFAGHGGQPYAAHAGLALEAQHWPDAPNHPRFPSILLTPAAGYDQTTRWRFGG